MKNLTKGKESKLILQFAWPMLLANVFQQLYNVVDSIVVGNYSGTEALAAVGASFPLIFVLISLFIGIGSGFTIIISQYFGANKNNTVKRSIETLYITLFASGILVSIMGWLLGEPILRLTGLPDDVLPQAKIYLQIYLAGGVLFFGFAGTNAILRGLGDSKTPLLFLIFSTLLNIFLDILFVAYYDWGVEGVAYATVISQGAGFLVLILYVGKKFPKMFNLKPHIPIFDRAIFKQAIRIGLPSGFQQAFVALGMLALYAIVNPFGTDVIAAYSVAHRLDSFASMPAMNFAAALSAFVGQNIGAGKLHRVSSGLKATLLYTNIIAVVVGIIMVVFAKNLMSAFTDSEPVIAVGVEYLQITGMFYTLFSSMFVIFGVIRGAGDTIMPMIFTFISLWVFRLPIAYYLAQIFGPVAIWWCAPIAWFIGLTLSIIYYKSGRWKKRAVVKYSGDDE